MNFRSLNHGPSQSGPYSRVRDLLRHLRYIFLLLLNNKEVQKLRSKLSGYMYVRYTLDTNPSTRSSAAKSRGAQGIDHLAALG